MKKSSALKLLNHAMLVLTLATFASAALAQDRSAPAFDKWRPKAGVYAEPGKNFQSSCDESGSLTIDLGEKSVSGYEWGCDVKRITDLGPDSLKVEMVCDDYNLAQNLNPRDPNWENRQFNEVMLIKRLDETTISRSEELERKAQGSSLACGLLPSGDAARACRGHAESQGGSEAAGRAGSSP
ncbi:hypothetical protein [Bradyrhizobium sp. SEMIA]|uniref:hypothetical protein n=1 Tax=Bradyrhizobium sp. SEMIA TaxID=2597515 RepID=UPI0018A5B176|nr:hypothetical protein [Bradyrhizobium sp. SEMIA]QOG18597.1 hypothetical protein FOM02_15875 [Bradyrhizobium sp. SEMIA]